MKDHYDIKIREFVSVVKRMETKGRQTIFYKLTNQQKEWLSNRACPICGLHKDKWKRRIDWRCCSTTCTEKFGDLTFIWQYFRLKIFERDNYTCVKCGEKTRDLIGDHIIPIAIGGEEYELDNVQTLCKPCNKIKTKKDMAEIALYRKKSSEQIEISTYNEGYMKSEGTSPKKVIE